MTKDQALSAAYRLAEEQDASLGENLFCRGADADPYAAQWTLLFQAPDCPPGWKWLVNVDDSNELQMLAAVRSETSRAVAQVRCPLCARPASPLQDFCAHCNAPLSTMASAGPYETVLTQGFVYREATTEPKQPIVVAGLWLICGPMFFMASGIALLTLGFALARSDPSWLVMTGFAVVGALIFGRLLYKSTVNFRRQRKAQQDESQSTEEASPADDDDADNEAMDAWPFDEPENVATFTVRQVVDSGALIKYVTHDADDGAWQFLPGCQVFESDARVLSLGEITALDPTVADLADLPPGWEASRRSAGDPWVKRPRVPVPH